MNLEGFLEVLAPRHELWPRKAMTSKTRGQVPVNSLSELKGLIEEAKRLDCYIQTHSDGLRNRNILTVVFIDLDFPGNLKRAKKVYERVVAHMAEAYFVEDFYAQFSGFKGFHILIPIKPVVAPEPNSFLRFMQLRLSKGYCDPQLLGDVVRLVRIPGTFNTKAAGVRNEKGKVIALAEWGRKPTIEELGKIWRDEAVKPIREWCGERYDPQLLWEEFKMSKLSEKLDKKKKAKKPKHVASRKGVRPEVQTLIDKLREGVNLNHEARLAILFELINVGWIDEEILEVFSHAPDYNPHKVQYFIRHARMKAYKRFSRRRLQAILERCI